MASVCPRRTSEASGSVLDDAVLLSMSSTVRDTVVGCQHFRHSVFGSWAGREERHFGRELLGLDRPGVDRLERRAGNPLQVVERAVIPARVMLAGDVPIGAVVGHDHSVFL